MKILEVTILDKNDKFVIVSIKYDPEYLFSSQIKTRKAYKKKSLGLWHWLDTDTLIYNHMDSLDAIVSTDKNTYEI